MRPRRVEAIVRLIRQGLAIEGQFGIHPLEALLAVALTVEEAVYQSRSFVRTPTGVAFTLANPPLRLGAFSAVRVGMEGQPPRAEGVRIRSGSGSAWREAASLSRDQPLELLPGQPTDFEVDCATDGPLHHMAVRVELQSVAIPPLVWFEFTDIPHHPPSRP